VDRGEASVSGYKSAASSCRQRTAVQPYEAAIEAAKRAIRSYPEFPLVYRWLTAAADLLVRIADHLARRIAQLLPRNWQPLDTTRAAA
jgi:hypothetical protein